MVVPRNGALIVATAGVVALMVFAFLPGALASNSGTSSGATPALSSSANTSGAWAYGRTINVTVAPLRTPTGWQYEGAYTLGYSVLVNEINDSAGPNTFELDVHEVEGIYITIEFCKPTCQAPVQFANLTLRSWEITNAWANFTTNGSVNESGTAVPAIALMNVNTTVQANLTERTFSALRATPFGPVLDRSKYFTVAATSQAAIVFTPALGVMPLNLLGLSPSNSNWTSESAFAATGSIRAVYFWAFHGPLVGNVSAGPTSYSDTFAPKGNVNLSGGFASSAGIPLPGVGTFPAIRLAVGGPFTLGEGPILMLGSAFFVGGASNPWATNQASDTTASIAAIDAKPYYDGRFGLAATSRTYSLSSANPANLSQPQSSGNGTGSTSMARNPVGSETLQGEPESVADVQSNTQCLTTGLGCPSNGASLRAVLAPALAAVVVAGAVGLIVAVVIADRRRLPPPAYPNSSLYPPGALPSTGAPLAAGAKPRPPAPSEDDPLDHLW
jgi:hypothetical protein